MSPYRSHDDAGKREPGADVVLWFVLGLAAWAVVCALVWGVVANVGHVP